MMFQEERRIEEELTYPLLLCERVCKVVEESESFKFECSEVGKQTDRLSQMLRTAIRLSASSPSLYEPPIRRILTEMIKTLDRALILVRKCKKRSILRRVVTITSVTDFRKVLSLLESSIGDMRWLLSIYDYSEHVGIVLSLPPIASNDPILAWMWSFIATIQMGQLLTDKIEAANELASLAHDNNRNKKIICEEGGVAPLLKLLKEGNHSQDAQIAASTALFNLANCEERVRSIVNENGVPIIVKVLGDSAMRVQIRVSSLVARMAEHDSVAQEEFARENVIRPLVTILSFETFMDNDLKIGKHSIHAIVQMSNYNYNPPRSSSSLSVSSSEGSSRGGSYSYRRERENEKPEVKLMLMTRCAEALWMLVRGSVVNSRKITETKGLLCLAKLIEKEEGELQCNCLMVIMEITAAAESNPDLRRAALKTNSPAAKAVVEQLLRVVKELTSGSMQIAAIKSIGFLARTFPARETRVIGPLVVQLSNRNQEVATEAAVSLVKFACPENFLHMEHSKAIIEFGGVPPLMRLLRGSGRTKIHSLILICHLALHAGNSEALEQARALTALEGADRLIAQQPELKDLVLKAINHLKMYHAGIHSQRPSLSYVPQI
ncbi:Armadillo [Dillenia turbinata]|uniref:Armadillo n=1 Tax=Dillenia turbinata TaxID=194707 RepID=A0AAN8VK88_9MAGN